MSSFSNDELVSYFLRSDTIRFLIFRYHNDAEGDNNFDDIAVNRNLNVTDKNKNIGNSSNSNDSNKDYTTNNYVINGVNKQKMITVMRTKKL